MNIKGHRASDIDFTTRVRDAEIHFIKTRGEVPKYLLLSAIGYNELIHELSVNDEYLHEINSYKGMHVLVSQDMDFPDIELAV